MNNNTHYEDEIAEIQALYDKWLTYFTFKRDTRTQFAALYSTLVVSGVLNEEAYRKQWRALLENDLEQIRKDLEEETERKKSKPPFHSVILSRVKKFIFRRFFYNFITR